MKIFINKYIYIFLLGGTSTLDKLQFDTGERGYLSEQLLNSSQGFIVHIFFFGEFIRYLAKNNTYH